MARRTQAVEVNSFIRGLVTEASPLTFPDNASLDEDNFDLRRDGSRDRRLGMDFETSHQVINTGATAPSTGELASSVFSWKNAGGSAQKNLLVVQTGKVLKVFDTDISPLSAGEIFSTEFPDAKESQVFSYTVTDGLMVVVTGDRVIQVFEYDSSTSTVLVSTRFLKIRDLFGVEDVIDTVNLNEGQGVSRRPETITGQHIYNLRNQTWGPLRENDGAGRNKVDTIPFFNFIAGVYPSNADNVNFALYPDPADSQNRTGDQFFRKDLDNNPPGNMPAPKGYFIIDALRRGVSRLEEAERLHSSASQYEFSVDALPSDITPGGPTAVSEYAGRVWYAGFSGEITDGDEKSPRMSSYLLYSQLIQDPTDIGKCYQEGDPTSKESPDLLDTDGGFIRIDGAYNIQALVNVGAGIMAVAENGVWMITGGSDFGFSANNNMRKKISENGAKSPGSVVVVDNTFLYWAEDGIYHVAPNEFGDYQARNLTQTTIQSFYDEISALDKLYAQGAYDSYDNKVRWIYRNRVGEQVDTRELILDLTLSAFYPSTVKTTQTGFPKVIAPFQKTPFRLATQEEEVVNGGETVVNSGETVVQSSEVRGVSTRETAYLIITGSSPVTYTFGSYKDPSFKDWISFDGVGVDAEAFLITGYFSGGDFQRNKQVPYIQFHFIRTEDGFVDDGTGNLVPTSPSGCLVQARWEWANSANSNRWGRTFQAYRYRRQYMPTGASDPFDSGFEVITTKNKLRGKGKVLSMKISTEPEKDLRLLGWSMLVGAAGNV